MITQVSAVRYFLSKSSKILKNERLRLNRPIEKIIVVIQKVGIKKNQEISVQIIAQNAPSQERIHTVIPTVSIFFIASFIHIGEIIPRRKLMGQKSIQETI